MAESEWRPPRIDEHLDDVQSLLRDADGVFVGVDFDGTLSPIESSPDASTIAEDCRDALVALASRSNAAVVVVSGRELADLQSRVDVADVVYAGNHGLELAHGDETEVHPAASTHRPHVQEVRRELNERIGDLPGCEVEDKDLTVTVHYRQSPPAVVEEVRETVREIVPEDDADLRVVDGKEILEVRPAIDWDKGSAILYVTEHLDADRRLVYLGDDVTDEDVFAVLGDEDVGVHVGPGHDSRADYRLESQADVAPFLRWLADALESPS